MNGKIHRASVMETDVLGEGSMWIGRALLDATGFLINERVEIYDMKTGARFATSFVEAPPGSGTINLNGEAARLATPEDKSLCCFDQVEAKLSKHALSWSTGKIASCEVNSQKDRC
ncbi:aspartate 1-decarboxylase [Bradyrhizobium sp. CCBAU 21362]|uniref:aspartate 1-decarboxylase n=1 Tax=Bradyrhizobium sp. CCBAU 21362 TaxID=1325082 RepID=UPI003FA4B0ED